MTDLEVVGATIRLKDSISDELNTINEGISAILFEISANEMQENSDSSRENAALVGHVK